jgi:hypothetical protein
MDLVIREHAKKDEMTNDCDVALRKGDEIEVGRGCCGCTNAAPNAALIPRGLLDRPKRIGMRFFRVGA